MYQAYGSNVYFVHRCGDRDMRATTDNNVIALKAAEMLNKADRLNDARKYTASARMHAEVEALPSVKFIDL